MADSAQERCNRGIDLLKCFGKEQEALVELQTAVHHEPRSAVYHAWLGYAYSRLKQSEQALAEVQSALQLDPNCAVAYLTRGREQKELEDAIADYTKSISLDTTLTYAYIRRGDAQRGRKDYDHAISDYTTAIALDPTQAVVYAARGYIFNKIKDYDRAITDYTKAIALDPNNANTYMNRGYAYLNKMDYDQAIVDCTRAIALDSTFTDSYQCRGVAYESKSNYTCAFTDYSRVMTLDNNNTSACLGLVNISLKRGDSRGYLIWASRYIALGGDLPQYHSDEINWNWAYGTIFSHLVKILLPKLRNLGEKFVDYVPCSLQWHSGKEFTVYEGNSKSYEYYSQGVGYVCLTDQQLWIVSLSAPSQRILKEEKMVSKLMTVFLWHHGTLTSVAKDDLSWSIPYDSVLGTQSDGRSIELATSSSSWTIYYDDSTSLSHVLTGIDMGKRGEFAHIWDQTVPPQSAVQTSNAVSVDPISEIERLGKLLEKGLITQAQFEAKRDDLLKRL